MAPWAIETSEIKAIVPMMIPSVVSADLVLVALIRDSASLAATKIILFAPSDHLKLFFHLLK